MIEYKPKANVIWINSNEGLGVVQNGGIRLALDEGSSPIIIFDQDSVEQSALTKALI